MKKIILVFTAIVLLFTACEKSCLEKKPKNLKLIDWENYNDVYTVYWNYHQECPGKQEDENKEIMVYGWIKNGFMGWELVADRNSNPNGGNSHVILQAANQVPAIIDSSDLTKKCFIKGILGLCNFPTNNCCHVVPLIMITNINDIYFEK